MEGTYCCGAGKRRDAEDREIAEGIAQESYGYESIRHPALDYQESGKHILCLPNPDSHLASHSCRPHSRHLFTLSFPGTKVTSDDHSLFQVL